MSIPESILRPIMLGYEEKRRQAENLRQRRMEEVYARIPRIQAIDGELESFGLRALQEAIRAGGDRQALLERLRSHNRALVDEKNHLLAAAGYTADYLELQYECPICKDTGYQDGQRCRCLQQQLIQKSYQQSNLQEALARDNFQTFDLFRYSNRPYEQEPFTPRENMEKIRQAAMDYVWHFPDNEVQNLLLYGTTGTGKTFLCSCIAKELLDHGYTVLYLTAYELCSVLESCRFRSKYGDDEHATAMRQLMDTCDLLIIDDLGTEFSTALSVADLFQCINQRLIQRRSTVISTNLSLNQLGKTYTDRLVSRLIGNYRLLKFYGPDLRKMKYEK